VKQKPQAQHKAIWFPGTGWALAGLLLIALGLLETRHRAESARQKAATGRQAAEWSRKEDAYALAARFLGLYTNAPAAANMVEVLRGIRAVTTDVLVADPFKSRFNSGELKAKLDLEIKKGAVPIDPQSKYELALVVDGRWYDADGIVMPLISLNLNESAPVRRPFGFNLISVASYRASRFAIVRTNQVPDVVSKMVESLANYFSKDYHTANP
jgi:hypothetical protein